MSLPRCTECRKTFAPAATARLHQRVCGEECRHRRRARLARRRRAADLEACREDECERQRKHRDASVRGSCHEPASGRKSAELQGKLQQIVDRVVRLSRATFQREVRRIVRQSAKVLEAEVGGAGRCHEPASAPATVEYGSRSSARVEDVTDRDGC